MMSEVYEVGRKSFEDMTEMLLNNKNISPEVDERYSEGAPVPLYSQTV